MNRETIIAIDKEHLKELIKQEMKIYGLDCDLNHIDVSNITDMSDMFIDSKFNGDISNWNVSNAEDISGMFTNSKFNGDISHWDVSNVKDMYAMFLNSEFNQDISHWDVSNVKNMYNMFLSCSAKQPWWYIEDNELRKQTINNYNLKEKLDKTINNNKINSNKSKI